LAVFFEKGASKRTYIPKPDGEMRQLGIAALEDKIVQQATRTVLECICEEDFLRFSYGFRPQHVDLAGTCGWLLSVYRSWCQYYAVPSN